MAKINGTNFLLYVSEDGGTTFNAIAHTDSCTLNINLDTPEATDKDSGGWEDHISGKRSWSIDFSGISDNLDSNANVKCADLVIARLPIKIKIGFDSSGERVYEGDATFNAFNETGAVEDKVTYGGSVKGKGALTAATVAP